MHTKLLMGNAAFAHAALEAGVNVVAGYPGTPSSEVIETIAALRAKGAAPDVHVEWSTNEKAALEVLAGASMAGARGLFTCKQVGLNVASDALMSLNYVGCRGGLVLFVADDPGPISSQTEQDTRRFASFAKVPVLDPATPEQGYAMMKYAFELSERYGTPVIVRPTTRINHASTFFDVADTYAGHPLPEGGFERDDKWIIFPRRAYEGHGEINERLPQIARESSDGPFDPIDQSGDAPRLGIVAGGVSAAYAKDALAMIAATTAEEGGMPDYRFWQVGTPYPFPEQAALAFCEGLDEVVVLEELDHVLEDEMLKLAGAHHLSYAVHGKLDGTTPNRGENSVEVLHDVLSAFLGVSAPTARAAEGTLDAPARPPVLCAGCPHRGSFYAVKKALGKRSSVLCGDIGCYTLGNAKPLEAIDTCLCMGASVTMAQGFKVVQPDAKAVAFIGDSTFFASGLTGVANAVYNGHDITIVVLDNSTTAMTGSQPHPGTGDTLMGTTSEPIDIASALDALGVKCITGASAFDLDAAIAAATEAIDYEGPSAVIYTGPCIQMVKPDAPVRVERDACTGCSACVKAIGCPAMSMVDDDASLKGRIMRIDTSLCTGCDVCIATCPFDAIKAGDGRD